jgi:hypothetical protein
VLRGFKTEYSDLKLIKILERIDELMLAAEHACLEAESGMQKEMLGRTHLLEARVSFNVRHRFKLQKELLDLRYRPK